ncbi:MAG: nuclear transport factor 2 family protein [Gammaproteobacteria bacterium]|nr:nuclear transport factor 2 family protein [Gammaproteobacteria bacterium]
MIIKMLVILAAVGTGNEGLRQEVICAETGFSRAAEAGDRERFLSYVDPDARFITSQVSRGREAVGEAWSAVLSPGGPSMRWRPAVVEVTSDGTLAISRGPYRSIRRDDNGNVVESWGHFISTWRRNAAGEWQVVFDTGGDVGMTPSAEEVAILDGEPDCP